MQCVEYGNKNGRPVVYFHGAPGAIEECAVFDAHAKKCNLRFLCFDRFDERASDNSDAYFHCLADNIKTIVGDAPVAVVGFSIGAFVALEVGAILGEQVVQTHLISAAAPIVSGDFLDAMAGAAVFKLAMNKAWLFSLLTGFQKLLAVMAPRLLVRMLFASAVGKDRQLRHSSEFSAFIVPVLKRCFQCRDFGYQRDVAYYVNWRCSLTDYASKVHLWHGTQDNWSPFAMATYLAGAIPRADVEALDGFSHYSCLLESAPRICEKLSCAQLAK